MFDGTLGKWNLAPKDIKLYPNVTPYHARPFTVPKLYEQPLKKEIVQLVKLGYYKKLMKANGLLQHLSYQKKYYQGRKYLELG